MTAEPEAWKGSVLPNESASSVRARGFRNTASANRFFVPQSLQVGIPLCGLSFAHVLTLQSYGLLAWSRRLTPWKMICCKWLGFFWPSHCLWMLRPYHHHIISYHIMSYHHHIIPEIQSGCHPPPNFFSQTIHVDCRWDNCRIPTLGSKPTRLGRRLINFLGEKSSLLWVNVGRSLHI